MNLRDTLEYYGKRVRLTCAGGEGCQGVYNWYQSDAESLDEPNAIGLDNGAYHHRYTLRRGGAPSQTKSSIKPYREGA